MSRRWVRELMRRFEREGPPGPRLRSRRPHHSPGATPAVVEERIVRWRKRLAEVEHVKGSCLDPTVPHPAVRLDQA